MQDETVSVQADEREYPESLLRRVGDAINEAEAGYLHWDSKARAALDALGRAPVYDAHIVAHEPVTVFEIDHGGEHQQYVPKWEYDRDFGEAKERYEDQARAVEAVERERDRLRLIVEGRSAAEEEVER